MLQVGDQVFGGQFVIVSISNDYHVFTISSVALGSQANPLTVSFDANESVEQITALLK